jgi:hypothetical protein
MSWTIEMTADRNIEEADVVSILSSVTGMDMSKFPMKQSWGWPSCSFNDMPIDVYNPVNDKLIIHGAWYSAKDGPAFARRFSNLMNGKGYVMKVEDRHGSQPFDRAFTRVYKKPLPAIRRTVPLTRQGVRDLNGLGPKSKLKLA